MSRVGKQIIKIPEGVKANFDPQSRVFSVTGPHGNLSRELRQEVDVNLEEDSVSFDVKEGDIFSRSLWGTYASHVANMIEGVSNLFEKKLIVEGVGYTVEVSDDSLTLKVGFSHPVVIKIPEELEVSVEKNTVSVKGIDKELVGSFCAQVRNKKKPEPYKGKGIRYENEIVRRKQGKRAT
ncbi:MAG: 50S ribosomal protein L6 [Patescibacteria group bacterium]